LATVFLSLSKVIGFPGLFIMCGTFGFIYLCIALFLLPETKGLSLERISQMTRADTDV